ncbi:hypothetical protein ACFQRB_19635 [Halobaculum litoreum]|uniref:Uncharacterized protein n=1 Tax=Halobaculum litoreum TaxID=3031998 RepID=A0ABD5XSK1_9EURY
MDWSDPAYEINKGLLFDDDERVDPTPDDQRFDVFRRGWGEAVDGDKADFGERAFRTLSWRNLGYRLGLLFDETPEPLQRELYAWCVKQLREQRGR